MAQQTAGKRSMKRVLIFSAAVGGGHLAAANAIQELIESSGHQASVIDGPGKMSRRLNRIIISFYHWQLDHAPWSYSFGFWLLSLWPITVFVRWLAGRFWGATLLRTIELENPDVIVSTYPVVTAVLGCLAKAGRLRAPVVATAIDFGVHPMWVSPDIDLHLVVSDLAREQAERAGGQARVVRLPIGKHFECPISREAARRRLGLPDDAFIPLIVGGAWGVGHLEWATRIAVESGAYPVVVTGQNAMLRHRLEAAWGGHGAARVIGWTDQMPLLMSAADCLFQNAGGVTCLEAMALGLPIVLYHPIPGHGVLNVRCMERARAAYWARSADDLRRLLLRVESRRDALVPPRREGVMLTAAMILDPPRFRRDPRTISPWPALTRQPVFVTVTLLLLLWFAFSPIGRLLEASIW